MTTFLRKHPWIAPVLIGVFWIAAAMDARTQLRSLAATVARFAAPPAAPAVEVAPAPPASCLAEAVTPIGEHSYILDRRGIEALMGDLGALSRSARIVPEIREGQPVGFRLYSVRPGGLAHHFGFRSGDVILTVNDLAVASPEKALEVYAKLKTADSLAVGMERNGERFTSWYQIH